MSADVKSATRVLEVLEHFAEIRRAASAAEIARSLGYPLSSTVVLLGSMAARGYLEQDARRAYRPTPRVTLLGAWISPGLAAGGAVARLMEELGEKTGETVVLATVSGSEARYIHVVPARGAVRMHVPVGATRPLTTSGAGRALLAGMPEEAVVALSRRGMGDGGADPAPALAALRRDLRAIRVAGHAVSFDRVTPGAGVVAVHLPPHATGEPMAVGIGAPSDVIRANAATFASLIKDAVGRYCGAAA